MSSFAHIFTSCILILALATSCEKSKEGAVRKNPETKHAEQKARIPRVQSRNEINVRNLTSKDMESLEKMLLSMDDGQRRQLLVEARDIRSVDLRAIVMAKIYFTGKSGNDFLKTVETVKADLGSGKVGIEVLRQGITDTDLPPDTATKLFLSLNTEARRKLTNEIAGKLELADLLSMPNTGKLFEIDGMNSLLASTVEVSAKALSESNEGRTKESIAADLEKIRKSPGAIGGIEIYIAQISKILPFETLEVLLDSKNHQLLADNDLIGELTAQMAKQNAREAIRVLQGKGLMTSELLGRTLWNWTASDPIESLDWLRNNKQLSAAELDAGYSTVSDSNRTQKNYLSAWQAVGFIADPDLKRKAEGRVWSAERDSVLESVYSNPSGTMNSLVNGKSDFSGYRLEGAMDAWMERDFENAHKWYQENWNSMPADKSQYLAASFAKQSLQQGDTEAAREWATHIIDPKTKNRIDTKIREFPQKQ